MSLPIPRWCHRPVVLAVASALLAAAAARGSAQTPRDPAQTLLWAGDGASAGAAVGTVVRLIEDYDRDGIPDFAIGIPRDDAAGTDAGQVEIRSSKDGKLLRIVRGGAPGDALGYALDAAGDVNGDGWFDLVAGAPYADVQDKLHRFEGAGHALVISGRDGEVLWTFKGLASGDALGWAVAGVGDLDGDGRDDVAAAAPFWDDRVALDLGLVQVFSGRTGKVIFELRGDSEGDRFGWALSSAGDVDRDKVPEILVGIEGNVEKRKQSGRARLYSGKKGKLLHTLASGQTEDYFGTAVAGAGDLDGDGRDDLLVGGWNGRDDAGIATGMVCAFSGRSGNLLHTVFGGAMHDRFGAAIAKIGDFDRDGCKDYVVGAPQEDSQSAGYVCVVSGRNGTVLWTQLGPAIGARYGTAVAGLPDYNGDEIPDVLIGAPGLRESGGWQIVTRSPEPPR